VSSHAQKPCQRLRLRGSAPGARLKACAAAPLPSAGGSVECKAVASGLRMCRALACPLRAEARALRITACSLPPLCDCACGVWPPSWPPGCHYAVRCASGLCAQAREREQWLPLRARALGGERGADEAAAAADLEERIVEFEDVRECLLTPGAPRPRAP